MKKLLFLSLCLSLAFASFSQQEEFDYRSFESGNWLTATWQTYLAGVWIETSVPPVPGAAPTITIRDGHKIEYDLLQTGVFTFGSNLIVESTGELDCLTAVDGVTIVFSKSVNIQGILSTVDGNPVNIELADGATMEVDGKLTMIPPPPTK